jgi:hypothetical protein
MQKRYPAYREDIVADAPIRADHVHFSLVSEKPLRGRFWLSELRMSRRHILQVAGETAFRLEWIAEGCNMRTARLDPPQIVAGTVTIRFRAANRCAAGDGRPVLPSGFMMCI